MRDLACWYSGSPSRRGRRSSSSRRALGVYEVAFQSPDLPPCSSSSFTSAIVIPRSTTLHSRRRDC